MSATAATVPVGTNDTTLFDATQDGGVCTVLSITNRDASIDLQVKVTGVTTSYVIIPPLSERSFRGNPITLAVGKVASGSINVNPLVAARL